MESEKTSEPIELLDMELSGLPPSVNHMYRSGRQWRYKAREVREYQNYAVIKMREAYVFGEAYRGRVSLDVKFETNDRRRWDIDNRVKALQDCLSLAGVIKDDSQLDALHVERVYGKEKGTRITLTEREKNP